MMTTCGIRTDKLAVQLAAADSVASGCTPIVSCGSCPPRRGRGRIAVPRDLYRGGDVRRTVHKRRLSATGDTVQTSRLVLPTALVRERSDGTARSRHQDWGLHLFRATRVGGVQLMQVGDVLVELGVGSNGSLRREPIGGPHWIGHRERGRVAQPGPGRLRRRPTASVRAPVPSRRGVSASLSTLVRRRLVPSPRALFALGLSGLLGRPTFERAMHAVRGRPVDQPTVQSWSA